MSVELAQRGRPRVVLDVAALDELTCVLTGAFPWPGSVEGQGWPERLRLGDVLDRVVAGTATELVDPQGTPLALVEPLDEQVQQRAGSPAYTLSALRPPGRRSLDRYYVRPEQLPDRHRLVAVVDRAPSVEEAAAVRKVATSHSLPVTWLAVTGAGAAWRGDPEETLVCLGLLREPAEDVVAVPVPAHDRPAVARVLLEHAVAVRYRATVSVLLTAAARAVPHPPTWGGVPSVPVPLDDALERAVEALDDGLPVPVGRVAPAVAAVLARRRSTPRGGVVLFTGLSGSGKSTLAAAVRDAVIERGRRVTLLDGDEVRQLLSSELGFSREDRDLNVRRMGWVAAQVASHGGICLAAPIAPYARSRADVRRRAEEAGDFLLVHVATPLPECERRDRKGLYAAARSGQVRGFTGVSDPYEDPEDADVVLDTTHRPVEQLAAEVVLAMTSRGWFGRPAGAAS